MSNMIVYTNVSGQPHRLDAPAITEEDGTERWFLNGVEYEVTNRGVGREWRLDNKLHNPCGPAIVDENYEAWWIDGKVHRVGGPAISGKDYESWWVNGLRHREDGPAITEEDGTKRWFLNGVEYQVTEENEIK